MMQQESPLNIQEQERELEEETKQKRVFSHDVFNIQYLNTSRIMYQQPNMVSEVRVKNYLCQQEEMKLRKITEIIYDDKLIRIEDCFSVTLDPLKMKLKKQQMQALQENIKTPAAKIRILNKNILKKKSIKNNKKNIVKNVVKIFYSWLQKNRNKPQYQETINKLNNLLVNQNFNNRLIKDMIADEQINKNFLKFLLKDSKDQIKKSRIQDKTSHYDAIDVYISLMTEQLSDDSSLDKLDLSENSNQALIDRKTMKTRENSSNKYQAEIQNSNALH